MNIHDEIDCVSYLEKWIKIEYEFEKFKNEYLISSKNIYFSFSEKIFEAESDISDIEKILGILLKKNPIYSSYEYFDENSYRFFIIDDKRRIRQKGFDRELYVLFLSDLINYNILTNKE